LLPIFDLKIHIKQPTMKTRFRFFQTILLLAAGLAIASCKDSIFASAKNYDFDITAPGQDSVFVIENRKNTTFIHFTFAGKLTHDVKIQWSPDSLSAHPTEYKIPAGEISIPVQTSDYYSQKVYIKYVADNDSTAGKLRINVKI